MKSFLLVEAGFLIALCLWQANRNNMGWAVFDIAMAGALIGWAVR
jgi:hypothetical protein